MPEALLDECFNRIIDLAGLDRSGEILDAGCGTGQICEGGGPDRSIPFSRPSIRSGLPTMMTDQGRVLRDGNRCLASNARHRALEN